MRDPSRPLPFLSAARAAFDLSLEGMIWSRRSVLMAVIIALPVLFGIAFRGALAARLASTISPFDLFGHVVVAYYMENVLPLAALFYAGSLIADEVEGKTITYLLTRPVSRMSLLTGKFAAYLVTTLAFALPATLVTFFLVMRSPGFAGLGKFVPDLFRDLGVLALTVLAYGAVFMLLGVLLRRPLIVGLLFIYVWEAWVSVLPGYLPRLTLASYLRSLVTHQPAQAGLLGLFLQVQPFDLSLAALGAVILGAFGLAAWIFDQAEYVLGQ
jgi:ABC-2 type transport system permease protein